MAWPDKIEKLRKFVEWECKDIPPDLVLAIIKHESGGNPGIPARVGCKCGYLPDVNGYNHEVCTALGLMQTIPATVEFYNRGASGADIATLEDMTGQDDRAIRIQIRTGCKYLAYAAYKLHKEFPAVFPNGSLSTATDSQIALVLTAYAVGAGNTAKKIRAAIQANKTPSFENIKRLYPNWGQNSAGKWINQPLKYASDVLANYKANRTGSFTGSRPGDLIERAKNTMENQKGSIAILAAALAGVGFWVNRWYSRRKDPKK